MQLKLSTTEDTEDAEEIIGFSVSSVSSVVESLICSALKVCSESSC